MYKSKAYVFLLMIVWYPLAAMEPDSATTDSAERSLFTELPAELRKYVLALAFDEGTSLGEAVKRIGELRSVCRAFNGFLHEVNVLRAIFERCDLMPPINEYDQELDCSLGTSSIVALQHRVFAFCGA